MWIFAEWLNSCICPAYKICKNWVLANMLPNWQILTSKVGPGAERVNKVAATPSQPNMSMIVYEYSYYITFSGFNLFSIAWRKATQFWPIAHQIPSDLENTSSFMIEKTPHNLELFQKELNPAFQSQEEWHMSAAEHFSPRGWYTNKYA